MDDAEKSPQDPQQELPVSKELANQEQNKENQNKDQKKKYKNERKGNLISEVRGEYKKIIWPSRKELLKQTATVLVVSLLFGVVIFAMDAVFGLGINTFIDGIILD